MKIALGCDHGGYVLKEYLKKALTRLGWECRDVGCYSTESCDYPLYGREAARLVAEGVCERGIVVCTTGIGISIAANKVRGIRCALCSETLGAELSRRHNDANVLALGAGMTGEKLALQTAQVFLTTEFEGGRHQRRVNLIADLEEQGSDCPEPEQL